MKGGGHPVRLELTCVGLLTITPEVTSLNVSTVQLSKKKKKKKKKKKNTCILQAPTDWAIESSLKSDIWT